MPSAPEGHQGNKDNNLRELRYLFLLAPFTKPGVASRPPLGSDGSRPKAYLNAGLQADEWPRQLTFNCLIGKLEGANAGERNSTEILLLPFAKPVVTAQQLNGYFAGRHTFNGRSKLNNNWLDLTVTVARPWTRKLGNNSEANFVLVRGRLLSHVLAALKF